MSNADEASDAIKSDVPRHGSVRVRGLLDEPLGRWLWLVKWAMLIPHYIVLFFLWVGFAVVTVVAFFLILITGRYPKGLFDFNLGVLRWAWRVAYYGYATLGTDRYPPFTFDRVDDYPAVIDVVYPQRLSRGLVLVKWWLLALPHYLLIGAISAGGVWVVQHDGEQSVVRGPQTGLIGVLVVIVAVALLFTARYPRGLHALLVGLERWILRVVAYVTLMTDEYPPFRLDQGGSEAGPAGGPTPPADLEYGRMPDHP